MRYDLWLPAGKTSSICGKFWNIDSLYNDWAVVSNILGTVKIEVDNLAIKVIYGRVNNVQTRKLCNSIRLQLCCVFTKNTQVSF